MKEWFTTTTQRNQLAKVLNELEEADHTIFQILRASGEVVIISFIEEE